MDAERAEPARGEVGPMTDPSPVREAEESTLQLLAEAVPAIHPSETKALANPRPEPPRAEAKLAEQPIEPVNSCKHHTKRHASYTVALRLSGKARTFYRNEAKRRGKGISAFLRILLTRIYEVAKEEGSEIKLKPKEA